jgi:hypothetical protein
MTGRYPNFSIAGAAKVGTTSLFEYLRAVLGSICVPSMAEPYSGIVYEYRAKATAQQLAT